MYTDFKTYADVCKDQGKNPEARPDYSKAEMSAGQQRFNLAVFQLERVMVSLNRLDDGTEWKPKPTETKWWPWAWIKENKKDPSASGVSLNDVAYDNSNAAAAPRLCARTEEIAKYAFETFGDLFREFYLWLE